MKALAALFALALVVAVAAPAGSQGRPAVVRPDVHVHTGVTQPAETPRDLEPFSTTLVLSFWVTDGEQQTLKAEIRCATPDYRAVLTKQSGEFSAHLQVEGFIQILRDGEILLVYEAEVGSGVQTDRILADIKGSVIMHAGTEKVLLKAEETSLHASFALDAEK